MNMKIANALGCYFETLYDLNKNLITFFGTHAYNDDQWEHQKYIQSVICAIPQLIPYKFSKKLKKYEITASDGLLEFSDELPFLKNDYESILKTHYDFLRDIKQLRNKLEHQMHGVNLMCTGGSILSFFDLFNLVYYVKDKEVVLWSKQFIILVKDINELFSKIQATIENYVYENKIENHAYSQRLLRYNFVDFNKIYDSELFRVIAKAFLPF